MCVCVCEATVQSSGSSRWKVIMTNVWVKNKGGNSIRCVSRRLSSSVRGLDDGVASVQSGLLVTTTTTTLVQQPNMSENM